MPQPWLCMYVDESTDRPHKRERWKFFSVGSWTKKFYWTFCVDCVRWLWSQKLLLLLIVNVFVGNHRSFGFTASFLFAFTTSSLLLRFDFLIFALIFRSTKIIFVRWMKENIAKWRLGECVCAILFREVWFFVLHDEFGDRDVIHSCAICYC